MKLSEISIHAWMQEHQIKNEKGDLIDIKSHLFQFAILSDNSQNLTVMKAAQVGLSTIEILKTIYDAKRYQMDIIYTLPTDGDVNVFVGGKVNRIIAQNPILLEYTKDKDSIEQKQVGNSMIYFRGTWTKKAAIMVTADRVTHDEKDSSKQDVINEYQARTQHSKYKQKHTFSHPSAEGTGVHVEWLLSDQKHWFIKCSHCEKKQYLSWHLNDKSKMSIDLDKQIYVCKSCGEEIYDEDRRNGEWVAKYKNREYSGYWVSLLMCPWVSAKEILKKFNDPNTSEEFFFNKVLGLPYRGKGNKLSQQGLMQNVSIVMSTPTSEERAILGIDTGLKLDYVFGAPKKGLSYAGEAKDYDELDKIMEKWPKCIAVVDGGGDLIGSRKFKEKWQGRVFLGFFTGDKKGTDESMWNMEERTVSIDRNKYIQIVVDEFMDKRIPLQGTESDWYDYWLDWNNLTRTKIVDPITGEFKGNKWIRSGRDHKALATVLWRVGVGKFGEVGEIFASQDALNFPRGIDLRPDMTTRAPDPKSLFKINQPNEDDWRN